MPPSDPDELADEDFIPPDPDVASARRAEVQRRLDAGESRFEVEDWLMNDGLAPGDASRLVDAVIRPGRPARPSVGELAGSGTVYGVPGETYQDGVAVRRANAAAARQSRPQNPPEVTDPQFAFAAGAEPSDHVKTRIARYNLLFRAIVVAAILCTAVGLYLVFSH